MHGETITIDALKKFSILSGLTDPELSTLCPNLGFITLKQGEVLFEEGEASNEIYLIRRGGVEICKSGSSGQDSFVIAQIREGEVFGELAFLDGSPRSAMVRASDDTELVVIEKKQLFHLPFSHRVIENIARASSEKLRHSASQYVGSLEEQLAVIKTQNDFGQFFIYILSLMAVGMIVNNLLHTYLTSLSPYSFTFFVSYSVILLIPSIMIVWKLKIPLSSMGVTLSNWKQSLTEGVLYSVLTMVVLGGIAMAVRHFDMMPVKPFSFKAAFTPWYGFGIYFLHSAAQELFARGFLQTAFERFFNDQTGVRSIGFTSLLFGLFHIHFGIFAVAITFVSGIIFGIIYRRHRNLIGVSLVHLVAGLWAIICGVL